MAIFDKKGAVAKKNMTIFFLIDVSNSMNDMRKIDSLNEAMRESVEICRDLDANNEEVCINLAVQLFGTKENDGMGCEWMYGEPMPSDRFVWKDVEAVGWTPMAESFKNLKEEMSRKRMLDSPSASMYPVAILMSDGVPCTLNNSLEDDYARTRSELNGLKENKWFEHAIRVAIAIGDDADLSILEEFTGNKSNVFKVNDTKHLKDVIEFVAARSSIIKSTFLKNNNSEENVQETFAEEAEQKQEDDKNNPEFESEGWNF